MKKPDTAFVDELTFYSLLSVLQAGMWLLNDIEGFLRRFAISHGRFSILLAVKEAGNGTVKPVELANSIGKSKPTVSKMLRKLEKDGLIALSPCKEDARSLKVRLLKKAVILLERIIPLYNTRILKMSSSLTATDKTNLMQIISRINFPDPQKRIVVKV